jgi:hypothetical protein
VRLLADQVRSEPQGSAPSRCARLLPKEPPADVAAALQNASTQKPSQTGMQTSSSRSGTETCRSRYGPIPPRCYPSRHQARNSPREY